MKHKHFNDGNCKKCREIINRYPGFHLELANWFYLVQSRVPSVHTSCAGRNEQDQDAVYLRGASRAKWGESSHNYGLGIDLFFIVDDKALWDLDKSTFLFRRKVEPLRPDWIEWGGNWKSFQENAHYQHKNWKTLVESGKHILIE